jgi:threonine dehydrogenase-like Zn-dependent dehydrogenase
LLSVGAPLFWGDETRKAYCQPPVIPGHEFVGIVAACGDGVEGYAIGEQIISEQIVPCGDCRFCRRAQYHMCTVHDIYGFHQATFGAMVSG